jgi:hypothetical protein
MAMGGNDRHTLDVFILCRSIKIDNRWNKSARRKVLAIAIDTSAFAASRKGGLTQQPEEVHDVGKCWLCQSSRVVWVTVRAGALRELDVEKRHVPARELQAVGLTELILACQDLLLPASSRLSASSSAMRLNSP